MRIVGRSGLRRPCNTLRTFGAARFASTTSVDPYPYPAHAHPTPHQIFHLPVGATQDDVKRRYYELVRVHHPDSPAARDVPSDVAQARFHSITAAYDALRGGTTGAFSPERARAEARDLNAAIWRAKQARKADLNVDVVDDQWKDRIIIGFVLVSVVGFVAHTTWVRNRAMANNLERARIRTTSNADRDARQHAEEDERRLAA